MSRFDEEMRDAGYAHGVQLMQSSGGMATVESVAQRPVNLLMSGPVAGLIGGIWAGRVAGFDNVVTLDIGGTSADIGVAAGGQLRMRHLLDTKIGDYQAMVPMVDIDTIGAGGGSIAYVDPGGVFRVGPQSAGADPGPACYGRGGTAPTSTDAQLRLGRLRADRGLLGGAMKLDLELAERALADVAGTLGMTVEEAALGALQIQKYGMTQAIELNSVRRGYDPREFTLVAAGGAGPLFACDIALELEIARVLVPPHPGIIAATGLLATDLQHEFVATERHALKSLDHAPPRRRFDELVAQAVAQLEADGVADDQRLVRRLADCRYAGQGYEVRSDVPAGAVDDSWVEELEESVPRARTSTSTGTASTHRSRSSTSAPSASAASRSSSRRARARRRRSVAAPGRSSARWCSRSRAAERHADPVLRARSPARRRQDRRARRSSSSTTRPRCPAGLEAEIDGTATS